MSNPKLQALARIAQMKSDRTLAEFSSAQEAFGRRKAAFEALEAERDALRRQLAEDVTQALRVETYLVFLGMRAAAAALDLERARQVMLGALERAKTDFSRASVLKNL